MSENKVRRDDQMQRGKSLPRKYESPRLIVYGSVSRLTKGAGGMLDDGDGLSFRTAMPMK